MTRTILILALFVFVVVSMVPETIAKKQKGGAKCKRCLKTIYENVLNVSNAVANVHESNQEIKDVLGRVNTGVNESKHELKDALGRVNTGVGECKQELKDALGRVNTGVDESKQELKDSIQELKDALDLVTTKLNTLSNSQSRGE